MALIDQVHIVSCSEQSAMILQELANSFMNAFPNTILLSVNIKRFLLLDSIDLSSFDPHFKCVKESYLNKSKPESIIESLQLPPLVTSSLNCTTPETSTSKSCGYTPGSITADVYNNLSSP